MTRTIVCFALLAGFLAPGALAAPVRFGVSEDAAKFADDGGASLFAEMQDARLTVNSVAIHWDPRDPAARKVRGELDRMLPAAEQSGMRIVFHIYLARPTALAARTSTRIASFGRFLRTLARRYPQVTDYIVGNEPNQPRFLRPQFDARGRPASPALYERLLAASYDALKAVDPGINVIGVALSPRGNDNPNASDNISMSPVRFLKALGDAYRSSGRTRPLMDQLAFHPYPNDNTQGPAKGYGWPKAGVPNLDRIKQAVWDAFEGTGQPTFAEPGLRQKRALTLVIDELAWQVRIPPSLWRRYFGAESVSLIGESLQARYYGRALSRLRCDPAVTDVLLFHFIDEPDLERFQSGLLRIDGTRRPAFATVRQTIGRRARCGRTIRWRHTPGVVGAKVRFEPGGTPAAAVIRLRAEEGCTATAMVVPAASREEVLSDGSISERALVRKSGVLSPYRTFAWLLPRRALPPGTYVYAVVLRAETNPARRSIFVSGVIRA